MDRALSGTGDREIGRDRAGTGVPEGGEVFDQRQFPAFQEGFGQPAFQAGPAGDFPHDPVDPVAFTDLTEEGRVG